MNMMLQVLMNRLQNRSPQAYQFINQAMNNGGNPSAVLKQMMNNATPEQRQVLISQAKNYGVPENVLKQIQNMK